MSTFDLVFFLLLVFELLSLLEFAKAVSRAVRLDGRRRATAATARGAGTRPAHEGTVLQLCNCVREVKL